MQPDDGTVATSVEEHEEWRVTGKPGPGYPDYDFTWSPWRNFFDDPERSARNFVALVAEGPGWQEGPYLSKRTVTITEWEHVEPACG